MTQQPRRNIPNWPELLPEILTEITGHLNFPADVRNFRATCHTFRSSITPPPLRLTSDFPAEFHFTDPLINPDGVPVKVIPTAVFLLRRVSDVSDTVSWMVAIEERSCGRLRMINSFSKFPVDSPKSLSGFESVQISKGFALMFKDGNIPVLERKNSISPKVVIWDNIGGRFLVLLHSSGVLERVCTRNGTTTQIRDHMTSRFDDITCRNNTIFAVDRDGRLYSVEYTVNHFLGIFQHFQYPYNNATIRTLVDFGPPIRGKYIKRKRLLLDSNGDVYMVVRETVYVDCQFAVFKLNHALRVWEKVVSLGDKVLFVTVDDCFFAWASDLGKSGIRGNCIVFPKDCFPDERGINFPDEVLFRGVSEREAVGVCRYGEGQDFTLISSLHGYSDLLRSFSSRVSAKEKLDEKQDAQMQCITNASSRAGLIQDSATADNYGEEVETGGIQDRGHENNFPSETQAGEKSADKSASEALAKPSVQSNTVKDKPSTELSCKRGIISVLEAQNGEPPRVYSETSQVGRLADGETKDERSSTRDETI